MKAVSRATTHQNITASGNDGGTGLYDYGYRDYNSRVGRFTTADPVRDGNNWYAYVNNDPVNFIDPTGLLQIEAANRINHTSPSDYINNTYQKEYFDSETKSLRVETMNPSEINTAVADAIQGYHSVVDSQVGEGIQDIVLGTAFLESAVAAVYGIAEIGTGLTSTDIPPSSDLFLEQITCGIIDTGFDKKNQDVKNK